MCRRSPSTFVYAFLEHARIPSSFRLRVLLAPIIRYHKCLLQEIQVLTLNTNVVMSQTFKIIHFAVIVSFVSNRIIRSLILAMCVV